MNRLATIAFAIVASLLVATAPVAATTSVEVVSINTTETDFASASLTNMSVKGTGSSATVEIDSGPVADQDDGGVSYWPYNDGTADDEWDGNDGTVSGATHLADGGPQSDGAYEFDGDNDEITIGQPANLTVGEGDAFTVSTFVYLNNTGENYQIFSARDDNSNYWFLRHNSNNVFGFGGNTDGSEELADSSYTNTEVWVRVTGVSYTNGSRALFINDSRVDIVSGGTSGTIDSGWVIGASVAAGQHLAGRVDDTRFYNDSLTTSQISTLYERTKDIVLPAEYKNNHSASNTVSGFANITTANNVSITATWRGDSNGDGSYDTLLNQTTGITSAANHSFTWSKFAGDDVQTNITVESTGSDQSFTLADEGVQAEVNSPTVDNSSASPTGAITTDSPTFEIDVNDTDFPTAQGDSVTVEIFTNETDEDGTSEGTDTLTSNGTASVSGSTTTGGDIKWWAVATDDYGLSQRSQNFTITAPSVLTIREERPDHPRIDDRDVRVKFFELVDDNPTIANRTVSDGNVSLSGLPTGSKFTVQLAASGYYNRTILIDDIFEQSTAFMLNSTPPDAVDVTYTISDPTGDFTSEETEIVVRRAINESLYNGSGGFSYMAVEGDRVGAAGDLETTLQSEERYRVEVRSGTETRILGGFTSQTDRTVTLRPSLPGVNVTDEQGYSWNASVNTTDAQAVRFEYLDPDDDTTDLRVRIYQATNESNEIYNQNHPGPHGYLKVTQVLSGDERNQTWVVNYSATRGGETISGQQVTGRQVVTTIGELDDVWKHAVAVVVIILVGGLFSVRNVGVGAVTTAFVGGGFWMAGWLPTAAGGAIMVALLGAVLYKTQAGRLG